jgi:hypothetical protein
LASEHIKVGAGGAGVPPAIHARYLKDEDRQVTGWIVGHLRSRPYPGRPDLRGDPGGGIPGPKPESLEAVVQFAHSPDISIHHAIGSAAAPGSRMVVGRKQGERTVAATGEGHFAAVRWTGQWPPGCGRWRTAVT